MTGATEPPNEILERLAVIERLLLRVLDQLRPLPPSLLNPPSASWPMPAVPPQPEWIPVLHRPKHRVIATDPEMITDERPGCLKPALYLIRPFTSRERADITAMRVCFPGETQWRQPKPGDISLCSSCGMPINPWSDQDLDYDAVLLPEPSHRVRRRRSKDVQTGHLPGHTAEAEAQALTDLQAISALAADLVPDDEYVEPSP